MPAITKRTAADLVIRVEVQPPVTARLAEPMDALRPAPAPVGDAGWAWPDNLGDLSDIDGDVVEVDCGGYRRWFPADKVEIRDDGTVHGDWGDRL